MEHKMLMWCKNVMVNEETQKELEKAVVALLEGPLKDKSEYAQEKCIKSFYEGPMYLEKLLLKQKDIYPYDSEKIMMMLQNCSLTQEEFIKRTEEVKLTVISEISRQLRHFLAFLN